jgi:hypothetical protein
MNEIIDARGAGLAGAKSVLQEGFRLWLDEVLEAIVVTRRKGEFGA